MPRKIISSTILLISTVVSALWALSGTGGVPLGGMGTGYVVYTGGKIAVSGRMPPAGANHYLNYASEKQISPSGFHFFVDGTAQSPANGTSEDAKCPVQRVEFKNVGDVSFHCDAFGPYWPGEGVEKYKLATAPLAFFDITAENTGSAAAEVAVAMEFGSGGSVDGTQGISTDSEYLMVDCDGTSPTFSAGGAGTFSSDGTLSNSAGNLVAAKCSIDAGGKVHFKFILGWYANYGQEGYYYENFFKNAKEAVEFGMSHFNDTRDGIISLVDRVMASNFPEWYKDRLLNNTYPLIHNSVCAKDGRTAFWEGCYGIIGTIDQGQHAAVFYSFNWPAVQWHELQYWARQQKSSGQVHHDFNQGQQKFLANSTANNRNLKAWDDKMHADYWWFPNTESWADLNCMFIFKAYELMMATGDHDSLSKSWEALKKSADRLASQCGGGGSVPDRAHSTYDRCQSAGTNCSYTPEYNGGIAIAAFDAMAKMADFMDDDAATTTYAEHSEAIKAAFKQKYGSSNDFGLRASAPNSGRFPESHVAGYAWANYLCLNPVMDEDFITTAVERMRSTQQRGGVRANGEWIFYCVDHYGGAEIAINRPDDGLHIHELDYDYYYKQVPNMVFWQSLQESAGNTHKDSYMTAPTVWHSYFQFCGYMIDNAFKRLWIRPRIPSSMKGEIKDALLMNPKGHGVLNYDENPDAELGRTQLIKVIFDNPVEISELVLKNNTDMETPFVQIINHEGVKEGTVTTEANDIEKNIRVALEEPMMIGPEGVEIGVYTKEPPVATGMGGKTFTMAYPLAMTSSRLVANCPVRFSTDVDGIVTMDLLSLNGRKIGTIMKKSVSRGVHSFVWDGKTTSGRNVCASVAILRISAPNGQVMQRVLTAR